MNFRYCFLRIKLAVLAAVNLNVGDFKKHDHAESEQDNAWNLPTHLPPQPRSQSSAVRTDSQTHRSKHKTTLTPQNSIGSPTKVSQTSAYRRRGSKRRHPLTILAGSLAMLITILATIFFSPFWASAAAIPVFGVKDNYTIVLLSYTPRLAMLRGAVRHYSRCPSAANVVVVWNSGPPPDLALLPSAVPIRVRVEETNSLNNRFRPDPEITTRAVLSIDDDIRIPCKDIEEAFAAWRLAPEVMHGFFPRLIDGDQDLVFRGEKYVLEKGQYNAVLTGAAFLDHSSAFSAYWADAVAPARKAVDDVFNGEDMLMNFVVSNASGASSEKQAVQFIRPSRRFDISKFSRVGISHNMVTFEAAAIDYFKVFLEVFGKNPLKSQDFEAALNGKSKPMFCGTTIGCLYI